MISKDCQQIIWNVDKAIVTKHFVQLNRLNLNADAECRHYSLCIILKWE